MPAKGNGITKRKDGRYMARYTVDTLDGPKRKTIYGRKYKEVEQKLAGTPHAESSTSENTQLPFAKDQGRVG